MNSRRITLTLGAAGGGLLAAAFLQTAVAFADTTDFVSPVGPSPVPRRRRLQFRAYWLGNRHLVYRRPAS